MGLGQEQLRKLDDVNQKRRAVLAALHEIAKEIPGLRPVKVPEKAVSGGFYGYRMLYQPEELGGAFHGHLCDGSAG
jgi:dTDP-4-amino-4,6-dideoxygalactose transaminase